MGFVDFTPKKQPLLRNAVLQVEAAVGCGVSTTVFIEDYISEGKIKSLYAMRYNSSYRSAIEAIAEKYCLVILNTPLTDPDIVLEKKRPTSFFAAQMESNAFNSLIRAARVVDLPEFDVTLTYDAVHFTDRGNELIFEKIKEYL